MKALNELFSSLSFKSERLISIDLSPFGVKESQFYIYLDHLNHEWLSGNKIRKLFGSLEYIQTNNYNTIVTIGGNYSNYLYACSFVPELTGIKMVAIIKGYEPKIYGYTLQQLRQKNIDLHFYSKNELKENYNAIINKLISKYGDSYFIPEGGSNDLAHIGFKPLIHRHFDFADKICVGVGTQGTYNGIYPYLSPKTELIGYAAMNDFSLKGNISFEYTFYGFAKMNSELLEFIREFKRTTGILLDPIYTSKMVFGIIEDYKKRKYSASEKIVAIHTGGLQGWEGMKERKHLLTT